MTSGTRKKLGRRELGRSALALLFAGACGTTPRTPRPAAAVRVWSWFDLPRSDPRSRELSGIAWDDAARRLWAVQDETRDLVTLVPDADLRTWSFGPSVRIASELAADLEGIALVPGGLAVASEKGPHVLEIDRDGRLLRELPLPSELAEARHNKSLESLTATPDGAALYTASEDALPRDAKRRHRIVRLDRTTGAATEHAYASDEAAHGHDHGVADLAAIADGDLLVLERGWAPGHGNTIRIYRVRLADASTCTGAPRLASSSPTTDKQLLVDLASLPTDGLGLPPPAQPQPSPLLDNFEGLALGPRLPGGDRALLLVSDDNARPDQVARLVVLAVPGL